MRLLRSIVFATGLTIAAAVPAAPACLSRHHFEQANAISLTFSDFLETGDVNNDGRDDVVLNQNSDGRNKIVILLSASNGSPSAPIVSDVTPAEPYGASYGRLGRTSTGETTFLARAADGRAYAVYAKGQLRFRSIPMDAIPYSDGTFLDFTGDEQIDYLFAAADKRSIAFARGDGNGQFSSPEVLSTSFADNGNNGQLHASIGYFWTDSVGFRTIAVGRDFSSPQRRPANISLYDQNPFNGGTWERTASCDLPASVGYYTGRLSPIHLMRETLILGQHQIGSKMVVLNLKKLASDLSAEIYSCSFVNIPNSESSYSVVGDFNGDGSDDIAWLRPSESLVYYAFADSRIPADLWKQQTIGVGELINRIAPGDFNGDGMQDLVITTPKRLIYFLSRCD